MTDVMTQAPANPARKCGVCELTDDHPKHTIYVGVAKMVIGGEEVKVYHPHDFPENEQRGFIHYHFDCDTEWNDLHSKLAVDPFPATSEDEPWTEWTQESADKHRAEADAHAATVDAAKGGMHGEELRQWIQRGRPKQVTQGISGGAGGNDQTIGTAYLAALTPNSSTTTMGTKTIHGPISDRFMTANGSDSANGTELATGGGYVNGTGIVLAFGTAASGSVATNAATSQTNMPACTLTGMEEWDALPQRTYWAPWTGGSITVGAGNTFTIASGSLTNTQS